MNLPINKYAWALAALAAALAFSLPLLFLLAAGGSHLPFANESLAYRYFANVRILDGQGAAVWTPQGQLVTVIQHLIVIGMRLTTAGDLKTMLQLYGIWTNAVVSLLMLGVYFAACFDDDLIWSDKALVLVLGPATIFGTVNAGFYYSILPDYYAVSLLIVSASVYLALKFLRSSRPHRMRDLMVAGALCGLAASNKVTLLGPAGIFALLAITKQPISPRAFFTRTVVAAAVCIGIFAFVFLAMYEFQLRDVVSALRNWQRFFQTAGAEPGFWEGNFWMFQHLYNYDKVFWLWVVATLFLTIEVTQVKAWDAGIVLAANVCVATLLGIGLYKRGAGTTFFEAAMILAGLAALALAVALGLRQRPKWVNAIPAGILLLSLTQFDFAHNWFVVSKSRALAQNAWEIRDYTLRFGKPVVIVISDHTYSSGGVEDLLNVGLRDFSTNRFDTAAAMKDRLAPNTEFRNQPGDIQAGTTVVWFEKWDVKSDKPLAATNPEEAKKWESVKRMAEINECRSWRMGYSDQILARVCSVER